MWKKKKKEKKERGPHWGVSWHTRAVSVSRRTRYGYSGKNAAPLLQKITLWEMKSHFFFGSFSYTKIKSCRAFKQTHGEHEQEQVQYHLQWREVDKRERHWWNYL